MFDESTTDLNTKVDALMKENQCKCKKFKDFVLYNIYDVLACHELKQKIAAVFDKQITEVEKAYLDKHRTKLFKKKRDNCQKCQESDTYCLKHMNMTDEDILQPKSLNSFKTSSSCIWYIFELDIKATNIYLPKPSL